MAKVFADYGEVPVTPNVEAIKAGMNEQLAKATGGAQNSISQQFDLTTSSKPVSTDVNGRNTEAIQVELRMPKLGKEDEEASKKMSPEVESQVDNGRLANMLEDSGYADKADDLRALDQARLLNNDLSPGAQQAQARIGQRMNLLHKQSAKIFGLDQPGGPKLDSINNMKDKDVKPLVQRAQQENPGLVGKDLAPQGPSGRPKEVEALNAQKRDEKKELMTDPKNVETISIGMTGMNFEFDRKNTIQHDAMFVPEDRLDEVLADRGMEPRGPAAQMQLGRSMGQHNGQFALRMQHHHDEEGPKPAAGKELHLERNSEPKPVSEGAGAFSFLADVANEGTRGISAAAKAIVPGASKQAPALAGANKWDKVPGVESPRRGPAPNMMG